MKLIVQKFGGSSISNISNIMNISKIITSAYDNGTNVIVVVSAQGNTTNELIEKMKEVNSTPPRREMDVLLSVGEQISISLLASYIYSLGYPVISLTGWQAGIFTDGVYKNARIKYIDNKRILKELREGKIVIVAGFQGIDKEGNITTLGRGGSDTSAVALAVSLKADVCQIYTDVDGVYTADPRMVKKARKIKEITFEEMLELSSSGAKVLHNRSVEMAKQNNLPIEVRSSFSLAAGTRIKEEIGVEKNPVRGITCDDNILMLCMKGKLRDINKLMGELERNNIILTGLSIDTNNGNEDISFVISKEQKLEILKAFDLKEDKIKENISKISIVGTGLMSNNYILSKLFQIIDDKNIKPYLILTGEINISIIIDSLYAKDIMNELHFEYNLDD